MNKSEKIIAIVKLALEHSSSYNPSYHVMKMYWNNGISDIQGYCDQFKVLYIKTLEDMLKQALLSNDWFSAGGEEWDETAPGPIFYVDETDPAVCSAVIEHILIEQISISLFSEALGMLEEEDSLQEGE